MFSTSEYINRALWALCEAHVSALTQVVNAAVEAGVNAAEVNADAMRGALASNTVLTRQWLSRFESNPTLGFTALSPEH